MTFKAVCAWPGCPVLVPRGTRYCRKHRLAHEKHRLSAAERGYGAAFQRLRAQWKLRIDSGQPVYCAACGKRINVGEPFDLGHSVDRKRIIGPEHVYCNRSDGGKRHALYRERWGRTRN